MKRIRIGAVISTATLALTGTVPAMAEDVASLAAVFGAREEIRDISISPGGGLVAIVQPSGARGDRLVIADLANGGTPRSLLRTSGEGEHIRGCSFATDENLICDVAFFTKAVGDVYGASRLLSVSVDGSSSKLLTERANSRSLGLAFNGGSILDWHGRKPGEVLIQRLYVPESTIGTLTANKDDGLGVESIDVRTLRRTRVEKAQRNAIDYIGDGKGTVRIMGTASVTGVGYIRDFADYFYRRKGESAWNPLGRVTFNATGSVSGFNPVAVDPVLDVVYGFDSDNGFRALFRRRLDGSDVAEKVLSVPGREIDEIVRLGRAGRVVGASYAGEYRQVEFFDPELAALRKALGKALPGKPLVSFVDASADEGRLLMFAGADTDPGRYYVFDKATRKLEEVLPLRTPLQGRTLAPMKPVQFPAADGTLIPGYLTLPPGSDGRNLPAIVMPHGGPGARDEWGFDWLVQFFAARGFAVLQPNFRGSAGYGEAWFEDNGFQSWRIAVGDVVDAGRWLVASGVANKERLAIFGWSYGGYAALQSGVLEPGLYKAIVAVAAVTDLELLRSDHLERSDYRLVDAMIGNGPHVTQGSPAANAAAIRAPVLMFHGDWDINVDVGHSLRMQSRLKEAGKPVELVQFPGLAHGLTDSDARAQMLRVSDDFLRRNMAMPAD